ncbi:hypothetical protein [Halarchaeum acidiphilum]|nr:hypothetical protein [Halarchaeum acidiphilum]
MLPALTPQYVLGLAALLVLVVDAIAPRRGRTDCSPASRRSRAR